MFERGCESGDAQGCRILGVLHDEGVGGQRDPERAGELFAGQCQKGNDVCCHLLAELERKECARGKAPWCRASERRLGERCKQDDGAACYRLGLLRSSGSRQNTDGTREAYERACELRYRLSGGLAWTGCEALASMLAQLAHDAPPSFLQIHSESASRSCLSRGQNGQRRGEVPRSRAARRCVSALLRPIGGLGTPFASYTPVPIRDHQRRCVWHAEPRGARS